MNSFSDFAQYGTIPYHFTGHGLISHDKDLLSTMFRVRWLLFSFPNFFFSFLVGKGKGKGMEKGKGISWPHLMKRTTFRNYFK